MKKLALLFAAAMFVCAFFIGCNNGNTQTARSEGSDNDAGIVVAKDLTMAYIDFDTLVARYNMYADMSKDFQAKSTKVETELTSKGRSLEKDIANYQERMQKGLLTSLQARNLEEELTKKQQEFMTYRDSAVGQLAEEENVMLNQIKYSIEEYVKEYNKDLRYSIILYTNSGGPIISADPSLNITREIVEGLNKAYEATDAAK